jgi:hypothetical protein
VTGNNAGTANYQGNPTGDVNFLFLAFTTHRIVINTCGFAGVNINTVVRVYDKCPTKGGVVVGTQVKHGDGGHERNHYGALKRTREWEAHHIRTVPQATTEMVAVFFFSF